jgi:hypothetical protein
MTASSPPPLDIRPTSIRSTLDRRFWLAAAFGAAASLVGLGLISAIIPNPVFGRTIPPDGSAIAVWLLSAPLMGLLLATFVAKPRSWTPTSRRDVGGSGLTLGGLATFFAIGCPVCNKIILLALGTSGALNVFAPIQPLIGVGSLAILAGTVVWSLRRRAEGCAIRPARVVQ